MSKKQHTDIDRMYQKGDKRLSQKERTQKTTLSLSKNPNPSIKSIKGNDPSCIKNLTHI